MTAEKRRPRDAAHWQRFATRDETVSGSLYEPIHEPDARCHHCGATEGLQRVLIGDPLRRDFACIDSRKCFQ